MTMSQWRLAPVGALCIALVVLGVYYLADNEGLSQQPETIGDHLELPVVRLDGPVSVESALQHRRSVRDYADQPLTLQEVSQLLWAAQGITHEHGHRTAPSAGGLYPLEIYLLAGAVDGLGTGTYRYLPAGHQLVQVRGQDQRNDLYLAALKQAPVRQAPIVIVFVGVYQRTQVKYGDRAPRYVHIEIGGAAENVYLQATALGLGTVFIGAFSDDQVTATLGLPGDEQPLGVMPVGRPRSGD